MFKEVKVVLLPTNQKSNIYLNVYADDKNKADKLVFGVNIKEELTSTIEQLENRGYKAQHLYFISDEKPQINDWYLVELFDNEHNSKGLHLEQCKSIVGVWLNNEDITSTRHIENCRKVIATNNSSLYECPNKSIEFGCCNKPNFCDVKQNNLPQPSQSFIQKYVEEYNKGNVITDVLVEYDGDWDDFYKAYYAETAKLKINSDNTINIKPIKDSWNRDEVINIIYKFANSEQIAYIMDGYYSGTQEEVAKEWIKENL